MAQTNTCFLLRTLAIATACFVEFCRVILQFDLRKPGMVEYFIFREIPVLNIQATLAC